MDGAIRVVVTLTFLLFGTSCDKYSPLNERVVRVHFSPAITVDEAIVYANEHKAKLNYVKLAEMGFVKTDSGDLIVNYDDRSWWFTTMPPLNGYRNPTNNIEPDKLPFHIKHNFSLVQFYLQTEIDHNQAELKRIKEEIDHAHDRLSTADLEVTDEIMWNIRNGFSTLPFSTVSVEYMKVKFKELNAPENCITKGWMPECYHFRVLRGLVRQQGEQEKSLDFWKESRQILFQMGAGGYLDATRIESMTLRVKAYRFMGKKSPVVQIERL